MGPWEPLEISAPSQAGESCWCILPPVCPSTALTWRSVSPGLAWLLALLCWPYWHGRTSSVISEPGHGTLAASLPSRPTSRAWGLGLRCSSPKALRWRGRGPCDSSLGTLMGELAGRHRRVSTGWVWLWPTLFSTCIVGHFMVMCCSSNTDVCIYF